MTAPSCRSHGGDADRRGGAWAGEHPRARRPHVVERHRLQLRAAGAIAGGLGGKAVGERVNPTVEEGYWRENYRSESYHNPQYGYEDYAPAYRTGYEGRARYGDRGFEQAEPDLRSEYERGRGDSRLEWNDAREATRAAWHRIERALPGDADRDGR